MVTQYLDPFFDQSTSCTADFAVALMLGRRNFDGYYPNYQVEEDPDDPYGAEAAYEHFLEWLDTSIFQILEDEALAIEMKKEEAIEAKGDIKADALGDKQQRIAPVQQIIDDCKQKLAENMDTVFLARKYLRDIDDELANKVNPLLREDTAATQRRGGVICITLASLERWIEKSFPKDFLSTRKFVATPVVAALYDPEDDQCNEKGLMNRRGRASLHMTLGVLVDMYTKLAKEASDRLDKGTDSTASAFKLASPNISQAIGCFHKDGSTNDLGLANLIAANAKPYGKSAPVLGQASERVLDRIEEAELVRVKKLGVPKAEESPQIT